MWVQTKTHVIDFVAPIFKESIEGKGYHKTIPRKMFQRHLSSEAESIKALGAPGDYFTLPNIELTNERVQEFMDRPIYMDLLGAANR